MTTRRAFLGSSASLAATAIPTATAASGTFAMNAPAVTHGKSDGPVRVISSKNGLGATKLAYDRIVAGGHPLDAVVEGVALVEADPDDTSVGYGGLPNERCVVELDAAVMDGATHKAGAVASIQGIKHPAQVALKVLRRTDHVLLVGSGALEFAIAHGFKRENLLTDRAREIWLKWKENLSNEDDWVAPSAAKAESAAVDPLERLDREVDDFFRQRTRLVARRDAAGIVHRRQRFVRPTGTIHCAALTAAGDVACTTTTSGLAFKIPGRVGDSPIIGAGLYADNEVGTCGSTGRGEANLQNMCSFAAVELMRQGASPEEAGMEVLRRVAKTSEPRLKDEQGRPDFGLMFYVLAKDGRYAGVTMWGPGQFSVTDSTGSRHEECKALYKHGE